MAVRHAPPLAADRSSAPPFRIRLAELGDAYSRVTTTLCLSVPLVTIALARHMEAGAYTGLTGLYAHLVFLGYYVLFLFAMVTLVFALGMFTTRLATAASMTLLTSAIFYLVVDSLVYRNFKFHIDAFWVQYTFTSYSGIGIPPALLAVGLAALVTIVGIEWGLFQLAGKLRHRQLITAGFAATVLAALVSSQVIHVVAYYKNDTRITSITPQLPFYYPTVSHRNAAKYGDLLPIVAERSALDPASAGTLHYPLHPVPTAIPAGKPRPNILMLVLESWRFDMMNETVSPHTYALGEKSSVFLRHFSSGNSTPTGVFGLFYGIHPTYWTAVKSNSTVIDNPLLIDALADNGYEFGIYAKSEFGRHKIKDTMFRGIEIHETFAGSSVDQRDQDLNTQLLAFMHDCQRQGKPFFGFAFYKSTHYSYYYPENAARFRPAQKLLIGLVGGQRDPELFLNDYRNSIRYVDDLIEEIVIDLERTGLLDETIIIITSDHGEEFNDNRVNSWGHGSNFTEYQTRVPLVFYMPGATPRRVVQPTTHVDVPTTLLKRVFGCDRLTDYSNGRDLFGHLEMERPLVLSGYVNHAFIMGDNVYAVFPMVVQKYKLQDINAPAGPMRPDFVPQVMEEMQRFTR
jgi:membrane-anchored protein YejM (alkaline phosphatase superfamily)